MTNPVQQPVVLGAMNHGDQVELARAIVERLEEEGKVIVCRGTPYRYNAESGTWKLLSTSYLHGVAQDFSGTPVLSRTGGTVPLKLSFSAVEGAVKLISTDLRNVRDDFFDDAPSGLAFQNGFVIIDDSYEEGVTMIEHDPDNRAKWSASADWDPKASGSAWRNFLRAIFPGPDQQDRRACIQEYIGASLLGAASRLQQCLVWIGDGANGKGVLSEITSKLFPSWACVSVSPTYWNEMGAHTVTLEHALLNIVEELPKQKHIESEVFKTIISGDSITCNRKYKSAITFRPKAGHIFSCNDLPEWTDSSHGLWRRLIPIDFERTFRERDKDWKSRSELIASLQADLEGVYSCVVRAGARAALAGKYTVPASSQRLKKEWREDLDYVAQWARTQTEEDWEDVQKLYDSYSKWAKKRKLDAKSLIGFGRQLSRLGWKKRKRKEGNQWKRK